MRHHNFIFCLVLALAVAVGSCQKADELAGADAAPATVAVSFRVSGFEQMPFPSTRSSNISSLCGKLCLAVYSGGKLDTLVTQQSSQEGFGVATLNLRAGKYRFILLAHSSGKNPDMSNPERISFGMQNMSDVFCWTAEASVSQDVAYDVQMRRAVAQVEVTTIDSIPKTVGSMYFIITRGSYNFNALTGYGVYSGRDYKSIAIPDSLIGKRGSFAFYTFPTADSVSASVTLEAMLTGGAGIYCSHDFKDVTIKRNRLTRLTGVFFKK